VRERGMSFSFPFLFLSFFFIFLDEQVKNNEVSQLRKDFHQIWQDIQKKGLDKPDLWWLDFLLV